MVVTIKSPVRFRSFNELSKIDHLLNDEVLNWGETPLRLRVEGAVRSQISYARVCALMAENAGISTARAPVKQAIDGAKYQFGTKEGRLSALKYTAIQTAIQIAIM
jgi:hypothetical protein